MLYVTTMITMYNTFPLVHTRPVAHKNFREVLAIFVILAPAWPASLPVLLNDFHGEYTVTFVPNIQTKQMALLAMRGQAISLAVNNITLLIFINTGIQYEQVSLIFRNEKPEIKKLARTISHRENYSK